MGPKTGCYPKIDDNPRRNSNSMAPCTLFPNQLIPSISRRASQIPSSSHQLHSSISKRNLLFTSSSSILILLSFNSQSSSSLALPSPSPSEEEGSLLELESLGLNRYTDEKEGFTLLIPSQWIKVDKAGATLLFQQGVNNVGVVVSPVRLDSLPQFGTPQFVLDKLIQAEKRKESTKDVEAISVTERSGRGGLQVYEFEYKLDSTRGGMKRIFSAAFVASNKLYLLNITHSDKPDDPLDPSTESVLQRVLHSFDIA